SHAYPVRHTIPHSPLQQDNAVSVEWITHAQKRPRLRPPVSSARNPIALKVLTKQPRAGRLCRTRQKTLGAPYIQIMSDQEHVAALVTARPGDKIGIHGRDLYRAPQPIGVVALPAAHAAEPLLPHHGGPPSPQAIR